MKSSFVFVIALSIVVGLFVVGCAKNQAPAVADTATSQTLPVYKNDKGEMICPVSGEVIKSVKDAAGFQDYKGMRYYFCCTMCPPKFKADPDKFVVRHELEPM
jgi:YHS domain-containing protein